MSWRYLSYVINENVFGYGDGDRIKIEAVRSMCCGDTSNNSVFNMPSHFGTHIDFPYHFSESGKKSSAYSASDFVFENVGIATLNGEVNNYLIRNENLVIETIPLNIEALIIKTDWCYKRTSSEYWEKGFGFHKETARFLKERFTHLKIIAFDLISLNSYQQREHGREAHKAFLIEEDILIAEDLDLRFIDENTKIVELIIATLQLDNVDGAPCTILAKTDE